MGGNRIGFVSSFDEANGTASVYYPDRNDQVTGQLPVFAPFGCMQKLKKDQMVLVAHLDSGSEGGIVMGPVSGSGAAIEGSGNSLTFKDSSGTVTLAQIKAKL